MAEPSPALEVALRALRVRDRSLAELERRLAERGFSPEERADALAALERAGLVDDARFAAARARALAERGAGDALIRHALREAGVPADLAEEALRDLEPEAERARRVAARRGSGPRTARYLRGKGFSQEAAEAVVAEGDDGELR